MPLDVFTTEKEIIHPVLLMPKKCTTLETTCEITDNIFIDITITSSDTEGRNLIVYSGFCNIKLVDSYDVNLCEDEPVQTQKQSNDQRKSIIEPANQSVYSSHVWIDPARSPYVYNNYEISGAGEKQFVYQHQTLSSHVTVQQHNTYITQNVYNYPEPLNYLLPEEFEYEKFGKVPSTTEFSHEDHSNESYHLYNDEEFECEVFLSQLPEEISEKETRGKEEFLFRELQSDNNALKQLMSKNIQSTSKPQKTIMYLGPECGQTVQNIAVNDPSLECIAGDDIAHDLDIENNNNNITLKKYQCDKCKQIFDHITAFNQHMVVSHIKTKENCAPGPKTEVQSFVCTQCGKNLKTQEKFELHRLGHGDPDLECEKCHKVFASKFTLRTHRKIHMRKYPCKSCTRSFNKLTELRAHCEKAHLIQKCDTCDFTAPNYKQLQMHTIKCHKSWRESSGSEQYSVSPQGGAPDIENETQSPEVYELTIENDSIDEYSIEEEIKNANSIIAKVMSNEVFLLQARKGKQQKRFKKACDVCSKSFTRIGDLKRHLIEHVIRSTLAKNPVNENGTLNMQCEVCQVESFSKVDKYKAHLREHAKLTLYQCTFCNKSFSDSSNFSKHKKIHGAAYFQCDLCQRKFNSKKMITQHMEYHNKNAPLPCLYCDKSFHFKSMLNKHIKSIHNKAVTTRFRCKFCQVYYKTLKEKWDHEWLVHNVRKMIVDCLLCDSKFRKYSELKRHCLDVHDLEIPPAKKLLQQNNSKMNCIKFAGK